MRLQVLRHNMALQLALVERQLDVLAAHFGPEVYQHCVQHVLG
jgi:hypothetical protein